MAFLPFLSLRSSVGGEQAGPHAPLRGTRLHPTAPFHRCCMATQLAEIDTRPEESHIFTGWIENRLPLTGARRTAYLSEPLGEPLNRHFKTG